MAEQSGSGGCLRGTLLWVLFAAVVVPVVGLGVAGFVIWEPLMGYHSQSFPQFNWLPIHVAGGTAVFLLVVALVSAVKRRNRRVSGAPIVSLLCLVLAAYLWFVYAPSLADRHIRSSCNEEASQGEYRPSECS